MLGLELAHYIIVCMSKHNNICTGRPCIILSVCPFNDTKKQTKWPKKQPKLNTKKRGVPYWIANSGLSRFLSLPDFKFLLKRAFLVAKKAMNSENPSCEVQRKAPLSLLVEKMCGQTGRSDIS